MNESELPTRSQPPSPAVRPPSALLPGTILAGRYRVVAPLGHGGMGDVYRADDLKLGQAVALKFLPPALRHSGERRQRLRDEVKIARLVAHPNVCRVWDLVEADGHEFLAMEYVDGEDLASVLRRIGRLPEERAVRMARELCAGLSAIHEQGILHRDLKPANVMVDGRGRVRIADFGLAALAESVSGAEASEGTPAYMSPEQREGREVTVRSDVYALGLVLYETFTGKPAFPGKAIQERGSHPTPSSPSSHVKELDPAIDRVIERCLEPDPSLRPVSVMAVAASLPGGDPLAAALAAGETPSPELVAAVGGTGGLRQPVALACLAAVIGGTALVAYLGDRVSPFYRDLDQPPQVLVHEGQRILEKLGPAPTLTPADHAHGFVREGEASVRDRLVFWYRESPRSLAEGRQFALPAPAFENPPLLVPGMAGVRLDADGRLIEYVRVPSAEEPPTGVEPDWPAALRRAGLNPESAEVTTPRAVPPVFADERGAWQSELRGRAVRVEAASFHGRPVWLHVVSADGPSEAGAPSPGGGFYVTVVIFLLAVVVARRQLRLGRGDQEGARRLAALGLVWGLSGPLKDARVLEPSQVILLLMSTIFLVVAFRLCYLALEPIVRRRWPDTLVSWTRLLRGRVLDPLVGRDVLLGVLGGVALGILGKADDLTRGVVWTASPLQLAGGWYALADRIVDCGYGVLMSLVVLLVFALLRQLLRRTWAAAAVLVFLAVAPSLGGESLPTMAVALLNLGLSLGILIRLGLLAGAVAFTVEEFLADTLMTTHLGAWYGASAVSGILATLAFAGWGFHASLGGRPLLGDASDEVARLR